MLTYSLVVIALCMCLCAAAEAAPSREPTKVDLRGNFSKWGLELKGQAPRGTCSVFAVTAAIEYALAKHRRRGTQLSEEYLNWAANDAHPGRDQDGGFFHELWAGFEKDGICPLRDMPYEQAYRSDRRPTPNVMERAQPALRAGLKLHWVKDWDVTTGLTPAHVAEMRRVLLSGYPVCAGMRWPKSASWTDGVLDMRTPDEVFDGHSIVVVGYVDKPGHPGGGVFLIRNSQDGGVYQAIPYEFVIAYTNDVAWVGTK